MNVHKKTGSEVAAGFFLMYFINDHACRDDGHGHVTILLMMHL
jgi:hypothetical protein